MSRPETTVRAWDWPTRAFHWTLVICLISAWASFRYAEAIGDNTLVWHRWNGYAILVLVVFRLLWGFIGGSTSRWRAFVRWPSHALRYALDTVRGRERHYLGHNPLGTYMILALLAIVSTQALMGLFTVEHNDVSWGPLYRLVSEDTYKLITKWHVWAFYWVILPLVALHVTVNVLYGVVRKDPLVRAMVTGKKPKHDYEDAPEAEIANATSLRALVSLAAAVLIVFGAIVALGGKVI
jgi:cytochrome b